MLEGHRHGGDRGAPIVGANRIGAVGMMGGDLGRGDVGVGVVAGRTDIDESGRHTGRLDDLLDVAELTALGVAGPDDEHGLVHSSSLTWWTR